MSLSLKEEFLNIQYYTDYEKRLDHFKDLDYNDPDIINHMNTMQANDFKRGIICEVF